MTNRISTYWPLDPFECMDRAETTLGFGDAMTKIMGFSPELAEMALGAQAALVAARMTLQQQGGE